MSDGPRLCVQCKHCSETPPPHLAMRDRLVCDHPDNIGIDLVRGGRYWKYAIKDMRYTSNLIALGGRPLCGESGILWEAKEAT